jgi:hypothetical protein
MKKLTQNRRCLIYARTIIVLFSFFLSQVLIFLFQQFLFLFDRNIYSEDKFIAMFWTWIILSLFLFGLTVFIGILRRWDVVVAAMILKRYENKKREEEKRLFEIQQKTKQDFFVLRTSYKPVSIDFSNTADNPFNFQLFLDKPLIKDKNQKFILPIVSINGIEIAVKEFGNQANSVVLFTRKAINHEKEFLDIKIGNEILMEPNPFWIDKQCKDTIVWQCQGHGFERIMMLSPSYFPKAPKGFYIPCYVKVHKELYGPYFGVLDELGNDIIIKLNKDFGEKDTRQKDSILVFEIGTSKHKIWLPDPSLLTRDGQLVA